MELSCSSGSIRISVGVVTLAVLLLAGGAGAAVLTVDDSGGANYTRIQDAIDNAGAEDIILVYSGTYYENVNVNKRLILKGIDNGGGRPVIKANGEDAITLSAGFSTLEGFMAVASSHLPERPKSGILLNSNNNTVRNNTASNSVFGIHLTSSSNNTLIDNIVSGNWDGIFLSSSSNNTLSGNNISNNSGRGILIEGIFVEGYEKHDFNNNIDITNKVNGKAVYYFFDQKNIALDKIEAGHLTLAYSSNFIIRNSNVNNGDGITLLHSSYNTLSGINASNNRYGIYLASSDYNALSGNNANSNKADGIVLYSSSYNILSSSNASNNYIGIHLLHSGNNNTLSGNNANSNRENGISIELSNNNKLNGNNANSNNNFGIVLYSSSYNILSGNIASNNRGVVGISLADSSNNSIYNNFLNNTNDIFKVKNIIGVNAWNVTKTSDTNIIGGPYVGGNVWVNPEGTGFSQICEDDDADGICDSSYMLASNNIDYLPLAYKPAILDREVTLTATSAIPTETRAQTAGPTEKASGFEVVLAIIALSVIACIAGRKKR